MDQSQSLKAGLSALAALFAVKTYAYYAILIGLSVSLFLANSGFSPHLENLIGYQDKLVSTFLMLLGAIGILVSGVGLLVKFFLAKPKNSL